MPELPEVETVRRSLEPHLIGRRIERVTVRRGDIVTGQATPAALGRGRRVADIRRHGKQLAIVAGGGQVICVHLGMTGQLRWEGPCLSHAAAGANCAQQTANPPCTPDNGHKAAYPPHTHIIWTLDNDARFYFVDPRRFGGVWTFADIQTLETQRWFKMGPDALRITPAKLHAALGRTRRPLKAALLDQHLLAGLGNIYVDELLFACRLHPLLTASTVNADQCRRLVRVMRRILGRAIASGGSTLRDYVNADGQKGGFQAAHRVYGRGGELCTSCGQHVENLVIAGRTTAMCPGCQTMA